MPDLTTTYLGLTLKNPVVASASPLSKRVETVQRLEGAGVSAVVLYSLFEEQITHQSLELDHYLSVGTHSFAESLSYFPDLNGYNIGPEPYLEHLARVKQAVSVPIIGSLNGVSSGGWIEYAQRIAEAGADALELNLYFVPGDPDNLGAELESMYLELVADVCSEIQIPVAVKLSPFFSSLPSMARSFVEAGTRGLVLFNRFYQPDLDIERLEVVPTLELSTSADLRLPLRWVAMLYGRVQADLALTSGVHQTEDVVKALMAGANVAMMASELIAHGVERVTAIVTELETWMRDHDYDSVAQMRGSMSQRGVAEPAAFERANYMKALNAFDRRLP
jgi:dihydroorotate dehydrogenase (fumarate)